MFDEVSALNIFQNRPDNGKPSNYGQAQARQENGILKNVRSFEFLVFPMGLCNAPDTFLALMNEALHGSINNFILLIWTMYLLYLLTNGDGAPRIHPASI